VVYFGVPTTVCLDDRRASVLVTAAWDAFSASSHLRLGAKSGASGDDRSGRKAEARRTTGTSEVRAEQRAEWAPDPFLVPKSKEIPGNPRLSALHQHATERNEFRSLEPKTLPSRHNRVPASHPGGRRFESG
jgi:hypothetical protein